MGFKYIMVEVDRGVAGQQRLPIIFPDVLVHDDVAKAILALPNFSKQPAKVVSAGTAEAVTALCDGESETLKLKSDETDTDVICSFAYYHGLVF